MVASASNQFTQTEQAGLEVRDSSSSSLLLSCHRNPCNLKTGVQCSKDGTLLLVVLLMSLA